jgi:hypothetical protein
MSEVVVTVLIVFTLIRETYQLPWWRGWLSQAMVSRESGVVLLLLSLSLSLSVTDDPIDVLQSQLQPFSLVAIAFHLETMTRPQLVIPPTE